MTLTYDVEANDLLEKATKIHCICAKDNLRKYAFTDHPWPDKDGCLADFTELVSKTDSLVCHNELWYDLPLLSKFLGWEYDLTGKGHTLNGRPIEFIDTLVDSRWLQPDRQVPKDIGWTEEQKKKIGAHSLEAWGYRVAKRKPQVEDWRDQHISVYIHRCTEDVDINEKTFYALMDEMRGYFGGRTWQETRENARLVCSIEHVYSHLFAKQARHGIKFNIKAAEELIEVMDKEREELAAGIEPHLPLTDITKSELAHYKFPASPRNMDGGFSVNFYKFLKRTGAELKEGNVVVWEGKEYKEPFPEYLTTQKPLTLSNQAGLKDYFLSKGWKPTMYNVKRGKDNKPLRVNGKMINTSPQMRDREGNICPNLARIDDDTVRKILRYDAVSRRRTVIKSYKHEDKGWLNHPRLKVDGRLPAEANTGGCVTGRVTHKVVANIPRPSSKVYGRETRALFYVDEGQYYQVGYDASGLEARVEAQETFILDGGAYAKELLEGDPHTNNAILWGLFTEEGEPDRNLAKPGKYGLVYGAQPAKLAATLKKPLSQAEELFNAFWDARPALRQRIDQLIREWEGNNKKYITGLDGRPLSVRAKHSIFNTRAQSSGAIVMKLAACIMAESVKQAGLTDCNRILSYHDEEAFEVPKKHVKWKRVLDEEEGKRLQLETYHSKPVKINNKWFTGYCKIGELGIQSIERAGKFFKFKVPLTGEYMIGRNWAETH